MAVGLGKAQGELYCPSCEQMFAAGERCPNDDTRLVRIAPPADDMVGREIDGRYTILAKIGQGGMGAVYRATQHSVGREVAIKVVMPRLVTEPIIIKRFLREAKLASRLSHPNAVSVLDFGQTPDGLFYLVMELVNGRTLERILETEGALSPQRLVRIGMQICEALEGAHELQIIHRDLKPQNVMILATGRDLVKVLDFGLAKSLTPDHTTSAVTHAGAMLGTPAYMPPELVTGFDCDGRADIYSLGCLLYVAATEQAPFKADSVHELMAMHATEPPPTLTNVPPKLAAVVARMLEKDPEQRYQTAAKARDALEASLERDYAGDVPSVTQKMAAGPVTVAGWEAVDAAGSARTLRPENNPMPGDPLPAPPGTTTNEDEALASHPTMIAASSSPGIHDVPLGTPQPSYPRSVPGVPVAPTTSSLGSRSPLASPSAPIPTVRGVMAPPPRPRPTEKVRHKSRTPIVVGALAGIAFAIALTIVLATLGGSDDTPAPSTPAAPPTTPAPNPTTPNAPATTPTTPNGAAPTTNPEPPPATPTSGTAPSTSTESSDLPAAGARPAPTATDAKSATPPKAPATPKPRPDPTKKPKSPPTATEPRSEPLRLPVIVNPGVQ